MGFPAHLFPHLFCSLDQKVTPRRAPRPQAEKTFFAKGGRPSRRAILFCSHRKVWRKDAPKGNPNRRHACGRDITGLRRGDFKGDQSPLSNPLVSDGEIPGRQSPELSGAAHPRWRAAAVGDGGCPPVRALRGAVAEEQDTKPKPSVSGFGLERRRNGMSLLSRSPCQKPSGTGFGRKGGTVE